MISCDVTDNHRQVGSNLLETAFLNKSLTDLDEFIQQWKSDFPPTNNTDLNNDTIRLVYSLFQKVFDPRDKNGYKEEDSRNQFVIVNSTINLLITDSLVSGTYHDFDSMNNRDIWARHIDENYKTYELDIHSFYPILESGDRALFLEGEYSRTISKFLPHFSYNNSTLENERIREEREEKAKFLQQRINIGSWGHVTYPSLYKLRLKSDFTEAYMNYYMPSEGYEVHLYNQNGAWLIGETQNLWIE